MNYDQEEYVALCFAWMNVSLDALVGTDQSKEKTWSRIEDYYCNTGIIQYRRLKALFRTRGMRSKSNASDGTIVLIKLIMHHQVGCKS